MDNLPRENNREARPIASMTTIRQILHENAFEISFDQVTAISEKHQLGAVQSFNLLQSGPMNSVFSVANQHCEAFILKVQYRRGIGSLEADHYVTNLLSESTSLPVSSLCLLDISGDIIVHPYLVLNQLPGEGGRCFFESTDYAGRMRLSEILGAIVGVIHRQKPKRADILRDNCLSRWREAAEKAIKNDETLRQAIGCIDSGFYPEFDSLMASIAIAPTDEAPILLWRDAVFHNLLVNPSRGNVEVTGICDFQFASYGHRIFDLLHVEGDFRRKPREIYSHPGYVEQFYEGYGEAGGMLNPLNPTHRILREIINKTGTISYWWNCGKVLHPNTPNWLKDILMGLRELSQTN